MRSIRNSIIYWDLRSKEFLVGPFPESSEWVDMYLMHRTWGGCNAEVRNAMSNEEAKAFLLAQIPHWVIRDGIDIEDIHAALWDIEEYRSAMSDDMPEPEFIDAEDIGRTFVLTGEKE